jgi:hypothetical protein
MSTTQIPNVSPSRWPHTTRPTLHQAATHLVALGFDEEAVGIVPRDFHMERERPLRQRMRAGLRWGAIVGASAAAGVGLVSLAGLAEAVRTLVPGLLTGAAALGLLAGATVAIIVQLYESRRSFGSTSEHLVPARYEVVVGEDRRRASTPSRDGGTRQPLQRGGVVRGDPHHRAGPGVSFCDAERPLAS